MVPKKKPYYIPVTWLPALLAGEAQCQFAPWVKAHFKFDKPEKDMSEWIEDHAKLRDARRDELVADDWQVAVEQEVKFNGQTATLAGRLDLLASHEGESLVVDAKTGKQRLKDYWQVLIYLVMVMKTSGLDPAHLTGEVCYSGSRVPVEGVDLAQVWQEVAALMQVVAGENAPEPTPSAEECRFCDVTKAMCPARIEPLEIGVTEF